MARHRPLIVTIHGINSVGAWQDDVSQVFEPHFRCVPLRYPELRRLGWLKILSPWLRHKALKTVARQFSAAVGGAGVRPYLIAHSFGTCLAVRLMRRPGTRLNRVIFVGSPLPAKLDWSRELARNPGAFYDLTNERGMLDAVISLASRLGKTRAGQVGFQRPPELIHDTGAMRDSCPLCLGLVPRTEARIHNLERAFRHSEWFVGSGHSANLWLPYFWGFPPEEYFDFIESCLLLDEMESRDAVNLRQAEETFRGRGWSWTRIDRTVISLGDYVARGVIEHLRRHQRQEDEAMIGIITDRAVRLIWSNIGEAIEERRKPAAERRENIVRRLHPQFGITAAIDAAVRSWSPYGRPGEEP